MKHTMPGTKTMIQMSTSNQLYDKMIEYTLKYKIESIFHINLGVHGETCVR